MKSSNKSRNGIRNLGRPAFHGLNHRALRHATTMLNGARRPRQPDEILLVCRLLEKYLRISKRMAKRDPHLFGPRAHDYYLDTVAFDKQHKEAQAALRKIYGPPKPGEPVRTRDVWAERYDVDSSPRKRRIFLHWFKEFYPDP